MPGTGASGSACASAVGVVAGLRDAFGVGVDLGVPVGVTPTVGVAASSVESRGSTEVPWRASATTSAIPTTASTTTLRTSAGYRDRFADQRSSMRPKRHTATEIAQASTNITTIP